MNKLDERDKKKSPTVQISSHVKHFFEKVAFGISKGPTIPEIDPLVVKFPWDGRDKNEALEDVRNHIEERLKKYKAPIEDTGGFKVVDVRKMRTLLNVDDEKIGRISGGTDILIVPSMTDEMGYCGVILRQAVIFEIETAANLQKAYPEFQYQCFLELLCARVLSDQPAVLLILTDLSLGAIMYEIKYAASYKKFTVHKTELSLTQMWTYVAKFLKEQAVPDVSFPLWRTATNETSRYLSLRRPSSATTLVLLWDILMK